MIIQHPANLDQELNKELLDIAKQIDCKAELGKTMCTYDFYEGNYTELIQWKLLKSNLLFIFALFPNFFQIFSAINTQILNIISQCGIKLIMTSEKTTLMWVLEVTTNIITSISVHTIRLAFDTSNNVCLDLQNSFYIYITSGAVLVVIVR